ncbi:putative glycolipid-binding domain-containing protein [Nonomuraea sp. PA05]|uniref:putative glycolipid-binding domain-containing protein n=1 Tax=Nonomuraea sp. PA05 TaxID=2604466 RepID=UPI0011DB7FC0|nr:putative glycolipid-binding domain-containing protein [Nonomuraea sp. PA05]TYB59809.1 putative glycolipid-binding domain-containing protein [Nonomuraea sp. PA05]
MSFAPLPQTAAWRHHTARAGFEVAYFRPPRVEGCTTAVEDGHTWVVDYVIDLDAAWVTRRARITSRSAAGARSTLLESDGAGSWLVDGTPAPHLDGCLDVDLEASAMTNTFPVHRLGSAAGAGSAAPAAYVRALDLAVERLEQHYTRVADGGYDYAAPVFGVACRLTYDEHGLVLDYPGLATRER